MKRQISLEGQEKIRLRGMQNFINAAEERYGTGFNYGHVPNSFRTQRNPEVLIECNKHKERFWIKPFDHLRSKCGGCKSCDQEQMQSYFLQREERKFMHFFAEHLQTRLDITSSFRGMTKEMEFRCKVHLTTSKHKPTHLMNNGGLGCPSCSRDSVGRKSRLSKERVIDEFTDLLPEHIRVLSLRFDNVLKKSVVSAECDFHGSFETTASYLRKSTHKCPRCGQENIGYAGHKLQRLIENKERGKPTYLGVLEVSVFGIDSLKVGVTTRTLEERYKWHLKKIFFSIQLDEIDAYIIENQIRREFQHAQDLRILKAGMRSGERWSGDTECYWFKCRDEIISFIRNFTAQIQKNGFNYDGALSTYHVPDFFPKDVSRNKDLSNKPIPVLGIDPKTNEVLCRYDSISEATRAGYKNVAMAVSEKYERQLSGGLRWFKEMDFKRTEISALQKSRRGGPRKVRCIETEEVFDSISHAEQALRARGIMISGSHISSVCKGKRRTAGGFSWCYET
jgi:hypothetical protein